MGGAAQDLAAQDVGAQGVARAGGPSPLELRLRAGGGADGVGSPNVHGWGAAEALLMRDWLGMGVRAELGTGAGFRSVVLAGSLVADLLQVGPVASEAHGGIVYYREEQARTGALRSQTAPRAGLALRLPLGPGEVVLDGSVWRGTVRGDGIQVEEARWTRRFMLGYGVTTTLGGGS